MPRKKREKSALGIYHVMLRGINKQDIFFNEDDFLRMMTLLKNIPYKIDQKTNQILSSNQCHIYAYCILHNHIHLLIREDELTISQVMKSIEVSYAQYYNKKYERIGHLYQGRFESEAINDGPYFHTVFRYIARNPVKAHESKCADDYPYSSWNEYVGHKSNVMKVLKPAAIQAVIRKYPLEELAEWINEDNDDRCLDMDYFNSVKSDKEAWDILSDACGLSNPEDFRLLDPQTQIFYLLDAIKHGINISQAARLGTISRYQIIKASTPKAGATSSPWFPLPENGETESGKETAEYSGDKEKLEQSASTELEAIQVRIRHIQGYGKKTYHKLHLIAEYLYEHNKSKCPEIAEFLNITNEQTRKLLVLLINENIVNFNGACRNRTYFLKKLE